jgi:hypothetical protein
MSSKKLRKHLLNWEAIDRDGGPGAMDDGRGCWHVFCHLAAASAIYRMPSGTAAWVGVLFDAGRQRYFAAVCADLDGGSSLPLKSAAAREMIACGKWHSYLEGASRGHILDRTAQDPGDSEKDDRRQDYDQNANSPMDGGPVWEMWTVSRDIRPSARLGSSLVDAYCELLSVLGGRFAAIVARGRMEPEYGHLRQLCAMIDAGFVTPSEALTDIDAIAIPPAIERVLLEATPRAFAEAANMIARTRRKPCYFMYGRKLSSFAPASLLRRLVSSLRAGID